MCKKAPGLGSVRSDETESKTLPTVRAGLHCSFRISRQMPPLLLMLQWYMRVRNITFRSTSGTKYVNFRDIWRMCIHGKFEEQGLTDWHWTEQIHVAELVKGGTRAFLDGECQFYGHLWRLEWVVRRERNVKEEDTSSIGRVCISMSSCKSSSSVNL